jgi:hypothetical protein
MRAGAIVRTGVECSEDWVGTNEDWGGVVKTGIGTEDGWCVF